MKILLILPLLFSFSYGDKVVPNPKVESDFTMYYKFYNSPNCVLTEVSYIYGNNRYTVECDIKRENISSVFIIRHLKEEHMEKKE